MTTESVGRNDETSLATYAREILACRRHFRILAAAAVVASLIEPAAGGAFAAGALIERGRQWRKEQNYQKAVKGLKS
jgi:hypothetical protein